MNRWWLKPGELIWASGGWQVWFLWDDSQTWGLAVNPPGDDLGREATGWWHHDSESLKVNKTVPDQLRGQLRSTLQMLSAPKDLSAMERNVLNTIAAETVTTQGTSMSGRKLRHEVGAQADAAMRALRSLSPRFVQLIRGSAEASDDVYKATLVGLLESDRAADIVAALEHTLATLRAMYLKDPDVQLFAWSDLADSRWKAYRLLFEVIIEVAGLSSWHSGDQWQVPGDLEHLQRLDSVPAFIASLPSGRNDRAWRSAPIRPPTPGLEVAKIQEVPTQPPARRTPQTLHGAAGNDGGEQPERFTSVELLGAGDYGEVWKALDNTLQRNVALKFVPVELRGGSAVAHARKLARFQHPNIVAIFDVVESVSQPGTDTRCSAVVMEYLDGPNLDDWLAVDQRVSRDQAGTFCEDLIAAVAFLHERNHVHGDLHGGNVLITEKRAVVIDAAFSSFTLRSSASPDVRRARDVEDCRRLVELVLKKCGLDYLGFRRATPDRSLSQLSEALRNVIGRPTEGSTDPSMIRWAASPNDQQVIDAAFILAMPHVLGQQGGQSPLVDLHDEYFFAAAPAAQGMPLLEANGLLESHNPIVEVTLDTPGGPTLWNVIRSNNRLNTSDLSHGLPVRLRFKK